MGSLTWEEDFLNQLGQENSIQENNVDEEDYSEQQPISRVKTYKDAILALIFF